MKRESSDVMLKHRVFCFLNSLRYERRKANLSLPCVNSHTNYQTGGNADANKEGNQETGGERAGDRKGGGGGEGRKGNMSDEIMRGSSEEKEE